MRGKILSADFFNRPTLTVAKELIGKFLVRKIGSRRIVSMITEVEAYDGFYDQASHASRGRTDRNAVMFGGAGCWYVYLIYGMYWMLNIVTGPKDYPAAILIRGVVDASGPGRLTKFFKINHRFNSKLASRSSDLWIEGREMKIPQRLIKRGPRVGVAYAGQIWSRKPWRFYILHSNSK